MEGIAKQITVMVIVFLMVCAGLIPIISASYEGIDDNNYFEDLSDDGDHPAYYNVTKYHLRGFTYSKETIKVSCKDAMAMKQELEQLESLPDMTERNRGRNTLFFDYNLLSEKRGDQFSDLVQFIFDLDSNQQNYGESFNLLIANIKGTLGPSYINLFHFIFFAPVFLSLARGVDIQLTSLFDSYHFQTENMVSIFAVIMVGTILVLPFISPNGYINADVILGSINELE